MFTISDSPVNFEYVVANDKKYQLTHLLEKGHVISNGTKRVFGRVKAYPHIKPVAEKRTNEFYDNVKQKIGG